MDSGRYQSAKKIATKRRLHAIPALISTKRCIRINERTPIFQRALDIVLTGFRWKTCIIYLDDIIVYSKTPEEHVNHLDEVLTAVENAGVAIRLDNCEFFTAAVNYLEHFVRPGLVELANKNSAAIQESAEPRTLTQMRSFLGMCNVCRRFFPNFARVASQLNDLLKKAPRQSYQISPLNNVSRSTCWNLLSPIRLHFPVRTSRIRWTPTHPVTKSAARFSRRTTTVYAIKSVFGLCRRLNLKKIIAQVNASASLCFGLYKFYVRTLKASILIFNATI